MVDGNIQEIEETNLDGAGVPLPDGQDARVDGEGPAGESPKAIIAAVAAKSSRLSQPTSPSAS